MLSFIVSMYLIGGLKNREISFVIMSRMSCKELEWFVVWREAEP